MPPVTALTLELIPGDFAVWKLAPDAPVPVEAGGALWSVTRTADELSVVGPAAAAPPEARVEPGWRALRVRGTLDFALTGILAGLCQALAQAEVSVFALSTFDTDWLLVRADALEPARRALRDAGYRVCAAGQD